MTVATHNTQNNPQSTFQIKQHTAMVRFFPQPQKRLGLLFLLQQQQQQQQRARLSTARQLLQRKVTRPHQSPGQARKPRQSSSSLHPPPTSRASTGFGSSAPLHSQHGAESSDSSSDNDRHGLDDEPVDMADFEVESMVQLSELPLFVPTVHNPPPPGNALEVLWNLSSIALFAQLHRGAFDANEFEAGVKLALPAFGQAVREWDFDALGAFTSKDVQASVKLTHELFQHADFSYDILDVPQVRLDHALVDDIWDRRSQLHIDVWTIVTEHFCVRSPDTGLPLHPRMNAPFTAVRRFRFSSVSDPEDPDGGRSWHISQILGPKGFPPSDPRPTFPF